MCAPLGLAPFLNDFLYENVRVLEELKKAPHHLLGIHPTPLGKVIRVWHPFLPHLSIKVLGRLQIMRNTERRGLFELSVDPQITYLDYHIIHESGLEAHDPYSFLPTFSKEDGHLFCQGKHGALDQVMGGRLTRHQGVDGVKFALWAPHARSVSLIGDFNSWNSFLHPMRLLDFAYVWELFVPGLKEGERYKFSILSREGKTYKKADPYAFQGEMRPLTSSIITCITKHQWKDQDWMKNRLCKSFLDRPINIYELHLGSWAKQGKNFINYKTLASCLTLYCKKMHYTHVEFMPIMGHPLDESWGYQVTGFYAISRRYGSVEEFQFLVDHLHRHGIGVILDWVPGHFPKDAHSIAQFDGTYLYEHQDPKQRIHPDWKTHIFDYKRPEVTNFLLGSALFYLDKMHIDGLRVDAVSSMVYLDYSRKVGEWTPNLHGGNENLEAIAFLRTLTQIARKRFPGVLMIAEESHAFPGVTHPTSKGGLGFHLKWNLGWMHDTLQFFQSSFSDRKEKQRWLEHEWTYLYQENYLLSLSHDEVVHEKKSLLAKMPGNEWEKFANMRLLLSYMMCHPGKKLLFMGGEFGLWTEWDHKKELPWQLTEVGLHQKLKRCAEHLNELYLAHPALWEKDFDKKGHEWIDQSETFSYLRRGVKEVLLCVHNFGDKPLKQVQIPFPDCSPVEIFNSDAREYGGRGTLNVHVEKMHLNLAPFATSILCPKKSI